MFTYMYVPHLYDFIEFWNLCFILFCFHNVMINKVIRTVTSFMKTGTHILTPRPQLAVGIKDLYALPILTNPS